MPVGHERRICCLRKMASTSKLVFTGRCCVEMVKWCCAANTNRACIKVPVERWLCHAREIA